MEPIGWVSCGCGKGVNIYARKQERKQQLKTVVDEVLKHVETPVEQALRAGSEPTPKVAQTTNREKALQERNCAWCGKPFKAHAQHLKCCTWDCYLKKKQQHEQMQAITALSSSAAVPLDLDDADAQTDNKPDV